MGLIDIGTNIGVYTVTAASMGRKVVGVEPYPPNIQRLAKTLRTNPHLIPYVTIVTNAVSNKYENLTFWIRNRHPGATQTHSDEENQKLNTLKWNNPHHELKNQKVETIFTDDLVRVIPFKKAILKIDIEGGEPKAIESASQLFSNVDITHVFFEWDDKWKRPKEAKFLIDFFASRGYTVHSPGMKPLVMNIESCSKWPFDIVFIKK